MNTTKKLSGPTQSFTLHAAHDRIYATNVRQKLIDLGGLQHEAGGYSYLLDGNKAGGAGFPTPQAALQDMAAGLTFIFLDGQFTALPDLRGESGPDLADAATLQIELEELSASDADASGPD